MNPGFPDAPALASEPLIAAVARALVDRQGRIRGYFDGTDWGGIKRLRAELTRLLGPRQRSH